MISEKQTIVLVDDSPANIQLIVSALRGNYNLIPFTSGKEAISFFEKGQTCDLILLDIEMPDMNGFETIKIFKSMDAVKHIPVIFITARIEVESELEGLSYGAVDYIYKPFNPALVGKRIELHLALEHYKNNLELLVRKKTQTIEKLSNVTISTIISLVGSHDDETRGHINRTSAYVVAIANELVKSGLFLEELTEENIDLMRQSAPLHDIGKVGISDGILKKPAKLTPEEFEEIKKHTSIGGEALAEARRILNEPSFLDFAEILAYYHHERWDGSGYPKKLSGNEIPIFARIMSIADVYDALISKRPYKDAYSHSEAVKTISEGCGTQFDPEVCAAFLRIDDKFESIAKEFADNIE